MHFEVEQKFPLENTAEVEANLTAFGTQFDPPVEQIDHYFRHPARDFAQTDEALRLRKSAVKTSSPIKVRRSIPKPKLAASWN